MKCLVRDIWTNEVPLMSVSLVSDIHINSEALFKSETGMVVILSAP